MRARTTPEDSVVAGVVHCRSMVWIISCKKTEGYTPSIFHLIYSLTIIQYHPSVFVSHFSPFASAPRHLRLDLHRHRWNHAFATSRWTTFAGWVGHWKKCCDVGVVHDFWGLLGVLRNWGGWLHHVTSSNYHNFKTFIWWAMMGFFDMDSFLKWLVLLMPPAEMRKAM